VRLAARFSVSIFVALAVAALAPAAAQDRNFGGVGLTVFADPGFNGTSATFRDDVSNLQSVGLNDRISSLRVGPGEIWEVCEHANYAGRCQVFSGGDSDLRRISWSDIISSARRIRGGSGSGRGGGGRPPGQGLLELYSRTDFSGERRAFSGEVSNLQLEGFNDEAMSLRVGSRESWQVCADANFQNCVIVSSNTADLRTLGLNRRVSSFRPWSQGKGRSSYPGGSDDVRLVLFDRSGYRGQALNVDGAMPDLGGFLGRAQSVQVIRGRWEVCEQPGFRGRCETVSSSRPDLDAIGVRVVGSVRPR